MVLGILRTEPSTSCIPGKCSTRGPHPQSRLVTGKPWEELAHPCEASFVQCRGSRTPPGADVESSSSGVGQTLVTPNEETKFHSSLLLSLTFATIQCCLELRTGFYFCSMLKNILGTYSAAFSKQRPCHYGWLESVFTL